MSSGIRRFVATAALMALLLAFPASAGATITGGCAATGTATSGGVDLTTATEWHLRSTDIAGGSGQGPTAKSASVAAYALGIAIPIASGTSEDGETSGSVEGVSVSFLAILGARFTVAGSADNGCAGEIEIIIDDVNPLFTALGGGGALLAVIGFLVVLALMRGDGGTSRRIVGGLFGLLGGIGAALALEQFGAIDATEPIGLFVAIGAAVLGLLLPGLLGGGDKPTPAPVSSDTSAWSQTQPIGGSGTGGSSPTDALGAEPEELLPPGGRGGGGPM